MPFLFSLPSAALTLDIVLEEADSAPMGNGALVLPSLSVTVDYDAECTGYQDFYLCYGVYVPFMGAAIPVYGCYDAALLPFGRVYVWRSDCQYIAASALYLTDTCTPFRWDTIYPYNADMPS